MELGRVQLEQLLLADTLLPSRGNFPRFRFSACSLTIADQRFEQLHYCPLLDHSDQSDGLSDSSIQRSRWRVLLAHCSVQRFNGVLELAIAHDHNLQSIGTEQQREPYFAIEPASVRRYD